jgi:RNA polymerase sigma-70 factor (ECF subfamily)
LQEKELIQNLRNNNQEAFKTLVEKYKNQVFNTSFGFLHNREDAEDIAQEVFIEVYRSIGAFNEKSKLSTWIYRIAMNKSTDALRYKARKKRFGNMIDIFQPESAFSNFSDYKDPQVSMENKEKGEVLMRALDKLKAKQRQALILSKLEGLQNKEIAEIMQISLASVEALQFRAKKNLKNILGKILNQH